MVHEQVGLVGPDDLVLSVIGASGGTVQGRTRLQKLAYFVSQALNSDAGYHPHYYGPYSERVSDALDRMVRWGLLDEQVVALGEPSFPGHDFRRRLHSYTLTARGQQLLEKQQQAAPGLHRAAARVVRAVDKEGADYMLLSYAAKLHLLLLQEGGRLTLAAARKRAQELGWEMSGEQMQRGAQLLQTVGLVTAKA